MLIFKNRKCFSNEGKMDPAKQGSKREKNIHEARFSEKEGNLLSELQASFAFLSHAERKIAGVLLKDPERFIGCSLARAFGAGGRFPGEHRQFCREICARRISPSQAACRRLARRVSGAAL